MIAYDSKNKHNDGISNNELFGDGEGGLICINKKKEAHEIENVLKAFGYK